MLTDEGSVYAWGLNEQGQLGIDIERNPLKIKPNLIEFKGDEKPFLIKASEDQTVILTNANAMISDDATGGLIPIYSNQGLNK